MCSCQQQLSLFLRFYLANVWSSWYPEHIHGLDHTAVFVRSSESPRCHQTAQAILSALFSTQETIYPVPVYGPPPGFDNYISVVGYGKNINNVLRSHYQVRKQRIHLVSNGIA